MVLLFLRFFFPLIKNNLTYILLFFLFFVSGVYHILYLFTIPTCNKYFWEGPKTLKSPRLFFSVWNGMHVVIKQLIMIVIVSDLDNQKEKKKEKKKG